MRSCIHGARLAIRDVHEFHADAAAIDAPRRIRFGPVDIQFGHRPGFEIAQRIEIRLQVSPAAK